MTLLTVWRGGDRGSAKPEAKAIPGQREPCVVSNPLYVPDHSALLVDGREATTRQPGQTRVDAVAVPASRDPGNLEEAAKVAGLAGRLLIVLSSHKCRRDAVRSQLAKLAVSVPVLIVDLDGYKFPHRSRTLGRTGWGSNTALKRNAALLLGRRLGLRHLLFLDDDVRRVDITQLKRSVAVMESGTHRAGGWKFKDFPDNSAVSHGYRALEKPPFEKQDCFIGGGGLLVRMDDEVPHFPLGIYCEDWFFLFPLLVDRQVVHLGYLKQLPFDPFYNKHSAEIQEFGDLIAEALFGLLARCALDPEIDLESEITSLSFWDAQIRRRSDFLKFLAGQLQAEIAEQESSPRPSAVKLQNARGALRAVQAAATMTAQFRPKQLRAWVLAWREDEKDWRRLWGRMSLHPDAAWPPDEWSPDVIIDRIDKLLVEVKLQDRVELLWPERVRANGQVTVGVR